MNRTPLSSCGSQDHAMHRRSFLHGMLAGSAVSCVGAVGLATEQPGADQLRKGQRHVLFIWLAGGASQFEMWDPKPGRVTGGPFRPIDTTVPGYQVCELMPQTAAMIDLNVLMMQN